MGTLGQTNETTLSGVTAWPLRVTGVRIEVEAVWVDDDGWGGAAREV